MAATQIATSGQQIALRSESSAYAQDLKVIIVTALLLMSAILGFVAGLFYRVWAVGLLSALIALCSSIILHNFEFRLLEGVAVGVLCLIVCQLAYLVAASMRLLNRHDLVQDEIDGSPCGERQKDIDNNYP